jgi:hypothetical protein
MSVWLSHVKKTMKAMKGEKKAMGKKWFSHVLKAAKKTYKKKGGMEETEEEKPAMGGRRRRKTQRK